MFSLVLFKKEAFELFEGLLERIDEELARRIFRIGVARKPTDIPIAQARTNIDSTDTTGLAGGADLTAQAGEPAFSSSQQTTNNKQPTTKRKKKLGRNDPCWCGSNKKWKKCHYPQRQ